MYSQVLHMTTYIGLYMRNIKAQNYNNNKNESLTAFK